MHLGVMKPCMFIRAHGCRESFVCVHDHESVPLVMKECKCICGLEFLWECMRGKGGKDEDNNEGMKIPLVPCALSQTRANIWGYSTTGLV